MSIQTQKIKSCKTVIIGESSVGKTSLATRFVNDSFDDFQESTIGAAFFTKNINNVNYDIWDTAGQERYHSLTPMYYRGAKAALVVFDITNRISYDRSRSWVSELRQNCNDVIIILVGNKLDRESQRNVEKDVVSSYAYENDLEYIETSAKDGTNINLIFDKIKARIPEDDIARYSESFNVYKQKSNKRCCS